MFLRSTSIRTPMPQRKRFRSVQFKMPLSNEDISSHSISSFDHTKSSAGRDLIDLKMAATVGIYGTSTPIHKKDSLSGTQDSWFSKASSGPRGIPTNVRK